MSRQPKIAALPESIREQVNLRLIDGHTFRAILPWLNQPRELVPSPLPGRLGQGHRPALAEKARQVGWSWATTP